MEKARIGGGAGVLICGVFAIMIAVLACAGYQELGLGPAKFFMWLGAALLVSGLFKRMFSLIEARLMDIERKLPASAEGEALPVER